MNYQELEKLKESREYKAADALSDAVNNFGWNDKRFAQSFATWHRTLQQSFFRTVIEIIRTAASNDYMYDGRNEAAHKMAKRIVDSGVLENTYLPCV